ncbi:MAG: hypothetical protein O7H41_14315 [Planctomycetota bacterium]|nr:hypothetical protein [Planctomycetota bacterium]
MKLKQPVTWDNPDVRILLNGAEQYTYNLSVDTEYDLEVTVHNCSRDKPAINTSVNVRWIEFGAGGRTRHPISTLTTDVPVWPGTSVVMTKWRTPDVPGHYCVEVELAHPNDGNPANNLGWNNTQVHAANSPVTREIRIFNRHIGDCPSIAEGGGPFLNPARAFLGWGVIGAVAAILLNHTVLRELPISLRVPALAGGGYVLMAFLGLAGEAFYVWTKRRRKGPDADHPRRDRTDCHLVEIEVDSYEFDDEKGKAFDPKEGFRGKPPVWPARVEPSSFVFATNEAHRDVDLIVDAPDEPGPPGVFNVNVRQGGAPSGGVTVTITHDQD